MAATAVVLVGCAEERREGPQTVEVTGLVVLDDDAVEGAHVTFTPRTKGPVAFGVTDKRGRYELRTFEPNDGAIPGEYDISVVKEVTEGGMDFENEVELHAYIREHGKRPPQSTTVNHLPEKYASPKTSELSAEVNVASNNHFVLELKSD